MSHVVAPTVRGVKPWENPWMLLSAAAGITIAGVVLLRCRSWLPGLMLPCGGIAILLGLMTALMAVNIRLRIAGWELDDRAMTAVVFAAAAFIALIASLGLEDEWDSFLVVVRILAAVGIIAAIIILLPQMMRRAVLVLLVLIHFGGILTAVTSVPPPGRPAPWLTTMVWAHLYRPYLEFMYLNNAYHFYSPEPGPPSLLWFRVEYGNGRYHRWVQIPKRGDYRTRLAYQRRLALTESANQINQQTPFDIWDRFLRRRSAGLDHNPPIPWLSSMLMPPAMQYREPTIYSKRLIEMYTRHVAKTSPCQSDPSLEVTGVKVYRVVHDIILPKDLLAEKDPYDPTLYNAFYQGEFDKNGNLKDPQDPFLYWHLPIIRDPKTMMDMGVAPAENPTKSPRSLVNSLQIHAGDMPELND